MGELEDIRVLKHLYSHDTVTHFKGMGAILGHTFLKGVGDFEDNQCVKTPVSTRHTFFKGMGAILGHQSVKTPVSTRHPTYIFKGK